MSICSTSKNKKHNNNVKQRPTKVSLCSFLFDCKSSVLAIDLQGRFGLNLAADDGTGEQGFDLRLNETLQGSCTVGGIVSRVNDKLLCFVAQFNAYLSVLQTLVEVSNQKIYDTVDVVLGLPTKRELSLLRE